MGMVSSVSVIFDTGSTYSCSSNKGDFVNLEEKTFLNLILPANYPVHPHAPTKSSAYACT